MIQDNAVLGALQGEHLWITCAYFVSEWWVFAVGLVPSGLQYFSASCRPRQNFSGANPITENGAVDTYPCKFMAANCSGI